MRFSLNGNSNRTQSIGTKVTPEDEQRIKEFCEARQSDVSTMTREIWMEKLGSLSPSPETTLLVYLVSLCEQMLADSGDKSGEDGEKFVLEIRQWFQQNAKTLIPKGLALAGEK